MNKIFSDRGWEDYLHWHGNDKKILKRIHELLKDIERNGNEGIGRPEPLKHDLQGFWSRRITSEHRLIYSLDEHGIYIAACRKHYE